MWFRSLGLPCWDCACVHAVAETGNPSSDDELCESVRCCLEDGSDYHDSTADEDGLLAPEHVTEPDGCYGAEEAAQCVGTD